MTRFALILLAASLLAPAAAPAFDCSSAVVLPCDGTPASGTINLPPESNFSPCDQSSTWSHKLYEVTLVQHSELTVSVTGPTASVSTIYVYTGCNETFCVAVGAANTGAVVSECLRPGTYMVAVAYLVDALFNYEITATCTPCDPVPADASAWGGVKALYR